MSRFIDLTGMSFGRLKVIKHVGGGKWLCECSCPEHNQTIVKGNNLKSGHTKSCTCIQKEKISTIGSMKKQWNPIEIDKYTYGIPLTRGQIALIDKEDLDKIKNYGWYAIYKKNNNTFYAVTEIDSKGIPMHRFILNDPEGVQIDHQDHNTLNNRKNNLRLCSPSQNSMNKKLQSNNTTGYKGVYLDKRTGRYRASIRINRRLKHLGYFLTALEANEVYQTTAKNLHGEFYCDY